MVLAHAFLVVTVFVLVLLRANLDGSASPRAAAGLLLLGGLAAEPRFEIRPEVLSWTLLAGTLYLLQRRADGRRAPLWVLPLSFWIWINAHGGLWVLGVAYHRRKSVPKSVELPELTLLTRPDCHLCLEAEEILRSVQRDVSAVPSGATSTGSS